MVDTGRLMLGGGVYIYTFFYIVECMQHEQLLLDVSTFNHALS